MSDIVFPFWAVYRILDGRLLLAEALGFPEAARLGSDRARVQRHLDRNIARLIRQTPLLRHVFSPGEIETRQILPSAYLVDNGLSIATDRAVGFILPTCELRGPLLS
jgi:hypothetical protein